MPWSGIASPWEMSDLMHVGSENAHPTVFFRYTSEQSKMLSCDSCNKGYHVYCLKPPMSQGSKYTRGGWKCKVCVLANSSSAFLLFVHVVLSPISRPWLSIDAMLSIVFDCDFSPQRCRCCADCGAKSPGNGLTSRWHLNYSICDSCYQQRNKGNFCPVCGKSYRKFTDVAMVQCDSCQR